ncbi:MAG: hypothetical protein OJF58_003983 [Enhydrobacter sp.]|nr:MAG: hypothetical protein OJF58_003983 [Enhydrobacter sp.]
MVESRAFIKVTVEEVRSALLDSNQVEITVQADFRGVNLHACNRARAMLLELTNKALKYAFSDGMKGMLFVRFSASDNKYTVEFEDDGIGIPRGCSLGFGTRNVEGLAPLMGG